MRRMGGTSQGARREKQHGWTRAVDNVLIELLWRSVKNEEICLFEHPTVVYQVKTAPPENTKVRQIRSRLIPGETNLSSLRSKPRTSLCSVKCPALRYVFPNCDPQHSDLAIRSMIYYHFFAIIHPALI
jgi:hypothetical protein